MLDCLIIGGGIIGLAIADELVRNESRVALIDRELEPRGGRRSSSLAAAGILPPPIRRASYDPLERIRTLSDQLFGDWTARIECDSGENVAYQKCGGLHMARSAGESVALQVALDDWQRDGVVVDEVPTSGLSDLEPNVRFDGVLRAYRLSGEQQVRPASLLKGLASRLQSKGIVRRVARDVRLGIRNSQVETYVDGDLILASEVIVAAGPWSTELLQPLGFDIGVEPFRGQMAMWQFDSQIVNHVINEGPRYTLCRPDGELIVGSTVEEAGFDCRTTDEGIAGLVEFAYDLVPKLRGRNPDATWAGLRPHSRDGIPLIGRVEAIDNLTVATGHFRSGVHLAPATARLVRQVICGERTEIDLAPFAARRN